MREVSIYFSFGTISTNGLEVFIMASGKKDKVEGTANQTVGQLKEAAGKMTGSGKTEAKGKAQQAKGGMQKGVGHLRESQKKQR